MGREKYQTVSMSFVSVEPGSSAILKGSVTKTEVKINSISVESFKSGFEDASGNDFATISFD